MTTLRHLHRVVVGVGALAAVGSIAASASGAGRHLGAQAAALRSPIGLANAAAAAAGAVVGAWSGAALAGGAAALCLTDSIPVGQRRPPRDRQPNAGMALTTANVLLDNDRFDDLLAVLLADAPDVLLLQEVTPEHAAILDRHLRSHLDYRALADPRPGYAGWATVSRFPVRDDGVIDVDDWTASWVIIEHPDTPVRVVNVHAPAPQTSDDHDKWERYLGALEVFADASIPTVLAGDFNATFDHLPLRRLRSTGLTDGFDRVGSGWGATWPTGRLSVPLLRLDHVLVDEHLAVEQLTSIDLPGSDHHGLSATLRVASSGPRNLTDS